MTEVVEEKGLVPKLRFPGFQGRWTDFRVDEIGRVVTGRTPATLDRTLYGGDCLFVTPTDMDGNRFVVSTRTTLSKTGALSGPIVRAGSTCVVCIASIGKIAQAAEACVTNQQINSVEPFEQFDDAFAYYALQLLVPKLKRVAGQQTMQIINKSAFSAIRVLVPDKAEQRMIAGCLESLDEVIAAEKEKLEALKRHKNGLLQQLFPAEGETTPRLRFPQFRKSIEWVEHELAKLVQFSSGGTPPKDNPKFWNGDIPWISAEAMHVLRVSDSFVRITADAVRSGVTMAPKGSLLILTRGSMLFRRVPLCLTERDVAFNQDVKCMRPIGINAEFLLNSLISKEARIPIDLTGIGAGKIETDKLKSLSIQLPPIEEQEIIATAFRNIDQAIDESALLIPRLCTHKAALMQQLFPSLEELDATNA